MERGRVGMADCTPVGVSWETLSVGIQRFLPLLPWPRRRLKMAGFPADNASKLCAGKTLYVCLTAIVVEAARVNKNVWTNMRGLSPRMIGFLCVAMVWGGLSVLFLQTACASSDSDPRDIRPRAPVPASANDQVEEFTRIIDVKLKTEYALAYIGRADAYRRRSEISAAVADYSRAIELKPDYGKAYAWRGYGYAVLRQDDRAAMDFAKAIELDRRDPLPYSCRGLASLARGNYDSAIADFSKAIELKPSSADDYANRALAYCCKNDYARAIEDYNKAIELRPTDAELYAKRAEAKRGFLRTAMEQVVADVKASERLGGRVDYGLVNEMSRLSGGVPADVQAVPQRDLRMPSSGDVAKRAEAPPVVAPAPSFKTFESTPMLEKPSGEPVRPPQPTVETKTPPADLSATIDAVVSRRGEPAAPKVAAAPEPPKPVKPEPVPPVVDVTEMIENARKNPNLDEQVTLLTKAIQVAPGSADAFTARGDAYMMKGDYDLAIKDYSRSIELRPTSGTPYNNRGVAYVRKNNHARALQDFDKAIQLDPTLAGAYYNRADANVVLQRFENAIADFSKAIELKPDDPDAYQGRAIAYYHKRSYDQAWADVMMCRRYNGRVQPEFEAALSRDAGQSKPAPVAAQPSPKPAEPPVQKPVASAPPAPVVVAPPVAPPQVSGSANTQAADAFKQGKTSVTLDEQIASYSKAISADPQYAPAYLERAAAYLGKGDTVSAIRDCTKYLDLRPADARAYALRGNAYGKRGDSEQALGDLNKAIDINPRNADVYYDRAMAYYDLRSYDKAMADTQTCQKLGGQVRPEFLAALSKAMGQPSPVAPPSTAPLPVLPEPTTLLRPAGQAESRDTAAPQTAAAKPAEDQTAKSDEATRVSTAEQLLVEAQTAGTPQKIEYYSKAIDVDPNCAAAYAARGDLYYAKGNYASAIYDFGKLLKLQPQNAEIYFARGQANTKNGDNKGAMDDLTRAIELKPDYAEAYQNRAMLYADQHMYAEAMADIQKAQQFGAQMDPDFVSAVGRVVRTQNITPVVEKKEPAAPPPPPLSPVEEAISKGMAATNPAEQIQWFNRAVNLDPKNANAYVYRGDAYCQQGDSERGIADYNQAILLNPKLAVAFNNRGVAWTARGELERAMWDFNDAIQRDATLAGAYYNRAQAYAKDGKFEQSIVDFSRFIELKPDQPGAYKNRAIAYYNVRSYDKAWNDVETCAKLGGKVPPDLINSLSLAAPEHTRTLPEVAVTPVVAERNVEDRYQDALTLLRGGSYDQAAKQFEDILQTAPNHPMTHLALGQIYSRQGATRKQARMHYMQFLQLSPEDPKAGDVQRWLVANP